MLSRNKWNACDRSIRILIVLNRDGIVAIPILFSKEKDECRSDTLEARMLKELHIFDFDGTLFRSPADTPSNHQKYERATGIPWLISKELSRELTKKNGEFIGMRRGWFGRPETLEPPLVPNPAPPEWFIDSSVKALKASKKDPEVVTLIMTGRHCGLKSKVLRICKDGGLVDVKSAVSKKNNELYLTCCDENVTCLFLGDDGPKPSGTKPTETLPWKVWIAEQYLKVYPEIKKVIFWEDRDEHVKQFSELNGLLAETVEVVHVKD